MSSHFNDSPIQTPEEDLYGFAPFAQSIAKSIRSIQEQGLVGTAIAFNGSWGSGKSSIVNLIRQELESTNDQKLVISDFKCWWYRGEEALVLAFLQNIHTLLTKEFGDKVKDLIPSITHNLLQVTPAITSAIAATGDPSTATAIAAASAPSILKGIKNIFFDNKNTVEEVFIKLTQTLNNEKRHFLIIIDDIDRLNAEEAVAIFRMIKSVGRLPNVLYLLVFDRILAEEMVEKFYPSEGPHFLEKIIQASFEIPYPLQTDINNTTLSYIKQICKLPDIRQHQRFMNMFYDVVVSYLRTPRDVVRFKNSITVAWSAIGNEINVTDFIVLEIVRLYEPILFQNIRINKFNLCGLKSSIELVQKLSRQDSKATDPLATYLVGVNEAHLSIARRILKELFPRFGNTNYNSTAQYDCNAERRVCVEAHFDTYFRSFLSDENMAVANIEELTSKADDSEFIRSKFRFAVNQRRRTGGSMVPVLLDEMISYASNIEKEKVKPLLNTLFQIHDKIDLDIDFEPSPFGLGSASQRYHVLIWRLTDRRFSDEERTNIYMEALSNACIGWLIDFTSVAKAEYREGKHRIKGETCLVKVDVIDQLIDQTLSAIRQVADKSLLRHKRLGVIFQAWRNFLDGNVFEIRAWTDDLLSDDEALVILVKHFTGETQHLSGPNDRIGERETHIKTGEMRDIIDLDVFHSHLKRLQCAGTLEDDDQNAVDIFLDLWDGEQKEKEGEGC